MSAPPSEQQQQEQQLQQPGSKRGRGSSNGVTIAGMDGADQEPSTSSDDDNDDDKDGHGTQAGAKHRKLGDSALQGVRTQEAEGVSSDEDEGYGLGGRGGGDDSSSEGGSEGEGEVGSAASLQQQQQMRRHSVSGAPEPIAPEMVTLSLLPRSQWQSLVHLEAIKARNK